MRLRSGHVDDQQCPVVGGREAFREVVEIAEDPVAGLCCGAGAVLQNCVQTLRAEYLTASVAGFDDSIGVQHESIARLQVDGFDGKRPVGGNSERQRVGLVEAEHFWLAAMTQAGGVVPGRGVLQPAGVRVELGVKRRHEPSRVSRIAAGQVMVEMLQQDSRGGWHPGSVWAMQCVTAITTAAGVPWPLTSAINSPQRPSGRAKKS